MPPTHRRDTPPALPRASPILDALPLYLPRAYYGLLGLVERELADAGLDQHLAPGMGHILFHLYEADDCIIREIGERLLIANGTLTGLLRRMQEAGLVECRRCAQDGRAVRVRVTRLGRSLETRLRAFHHRIVTTVERDLSATEVQTTKLVLAKIIQTLRTAAAAPPTARATAKRRLRKSTAPK